MTNEIIIGMAVFFSAIVINRIIMTNAIKKLDDQTKLKFFDVFPKRNSFELIVSLVLIFVYFAVWRAMPQFAFYITVIYFAVFVVYTIVSFISNYKKLKEINTPADYIRSFVIGYNIFVVGFLIFAASNLYFWFRVSK